MGMQILYERRDSGLGIGLGLFSSRRVTSGTCIWRFQSGVNVSEYDEAATFRHLAKKSLLEAQQWLDLTYGFRGKICEILDDGKYMNHSETPNCRTDPQTGHTYAIRDIHEGEQLFEDYSSFDHPPFLYVCLEKYNCAPKYYDYLACDYSRIEDRNDLIADSVPNMLSSF